MEFSDEEKIAVEQSRIVKILQEKEEGLTLEEVQTEYKNRHKNDVEHFKTEFTTLEAFLKYRCKVKVSSGKFCLSNAPQEPASTSNVPQTALLVSRPQFSQFYGFSDIDKLKGVPYKVWRFEVDSALRGGLYSDQVIAEQIRRSLQAEAKTKLVGLGPETTCKNILVKLDQFYSDVGAATGDELLAEAYKFRQGEHEEVAAFASRLDNQVRMAKLRETEILPDEESIERQLRMLFWEGIRDPIKDKARHKKDGCKSFSELIMAARYGEKESNSTQFPKRSARSNQISVKETQETQVENDSKPPPWVAEVCSMAREVNQMMKEQKWQSKSEHSNRGEGAETPNWVPRNNYKSKAPTCFRCGQAGHIQIGCRNELTEDSEKVGNDQRPLPRGNQRS